jgi:hypothetical protein
MKTGPLESGMQSQSPQEARFFFTTRNRRKARNIRDPDEQTFFCVSLRFLITFEIFAFASLTPRFWILAP